MLKKKYCKKAITAVWNWFEQANPKICIGEEIPFDLQKYLEDLNEAFPYKEGENNRRIGAEEEYVEKPPI